MTLNCKNKTLIKKVNTYTLQTIRRSVVFKILLNLEVDVRMIQLGFKRKIENKNLKKEFDCFFVISHSLSDIFYFSLV